MRNGPMLARALPGAKREYSVRMNSAEEADIMLYDVIGEDWWTGEGVTAKRFAQDLKNITAKTINLRINSPGGLVFDGFAMYTALKEKDAKIIAHVDGMAASAASVVALGADEVRISETGYFMIHNVWGGAWGEAKDLRAEADLMDKLTGTIIDVYEAKTGKDRADLAAKMDAETWFTGQEAVDFGFADSVKDGKKAAAMALFDPSCFKNAPSALRQAAKTAAAMNSLRSAGDERSKSELTDIAHLIGQGTAILTA